MLNCGIIVSPELLTALLGVFRSKKKAVTL